MNTLQLKILTCVDGSEESRKAISLSGKFVNITGASLILVHVLDDLVSYAEVPDTDIYKERKEAGLKLLKESEKLVKAEEAACTTRLIVGPVAPEIVRLAEKENINLEQVIAVGDGANDLDMLAISGLGIAFRAKPLVKENAKQAISTLGLDGILYLIGVTDWDLIGFNK